MLIRLCFTFIVFTIKVTQGYCSKMGKDTQDQTRIWILNCNESAAQLSTFTTLCLPTKWYKEDTASILDAIQHIQVPICPNLINFTSHLYDYSQFPSTIFQNIFSTSTEYHVPLSWEHFLDLGKMGQVIVHWLTRYDSTRKLQGGYIGCESWLLTLFIPLLSLASNY